MINIRVILIAAMLALFAQSCMFFRVTRTETDTYTVSDLDTTIVNYVQNDPGNRDNGVIYPSSRAVRVTRNLVQEDSIVEKHYPDFIRIGLFESVGTLGGNSENAIGTGLFGAYPEFLNVDEFYRGNPDESYIFPGGIYRFGIGEWRLRWFRDAPDWTIGTHMFEAIIPDARMEKSLMTIFPLYIRKRFYLDRDIPYICITPAVGFGWFPINFSNYVNASVSLDVGSIGGLNVRAYVGMAAGVNANNSTLIRSSEFTDDGQSSIIPYGGLGVSVLDFHNLVPETLSEWKDHEHSSWEVGLAQFGIIGSGADISALGGDTTDTGFLKGYVLKLANANIALPVLDYKLYAGTTLFNLLILGQDEWGMSILPIRLGYWATLVKDELSAEPFIEYNYYPSSFFHIGGRVNMRIGEDYSISFIVGLASGSTDSGVERNLEAQFGIPGNLSDAYFGVSFNFLDRIFFPEELRYGLE